MAGEPVLEHEGGHAEVIEIAGGLDAFGLEDEFAMATARKDQDGRAVGFFFWRKKNSDGRIVNVADPVIFGFFRFVAAIFESRRALFPKGDHLRFLGEECERGC